MLPEFSIFSVTVNSYYFVLSLVFSFSLLIWNWQLEQLAKPDSRGHPGHRSLPQPRLPSKHGVITGQDHRFGLTLAGILMVAGFIGARALHVFLEDFPRYKESPLQVFYFWQGGFVFLGGFLLAFLAGLGFAWKQGQAWRKWADLLTPYVCGGYGLGRIACFLNGCCYGHFCELAWAINGRHPTQLYMIAWELTVFCMLQMSPIKNRLALIQGRTFFFWLFLHALGRLIVEQFRDDHRGEFFLGLSPSSWMTLGLMILATSQLVSKKFIRLPKPLMLTF